MSPTHPPDAALPGEVERCEHCGGPRAHAFCPMRFCSLCGGYYDFRGDHADCQPFDAKIQEVLRHMEDAGLSWQSDTLRAHIAALTAERDALRALVGKMAAFVKDVHEFRLDDEADYTQRSLPFNVCDYYHMEDLMKEAARLERAAPPPSEAASGQEGSG